MTAKLKAPTLLAGNAAGATMLAAVPLTAADVAALQKEAEDDREIYESLTCADEAEYELADALLSEVARREAAATAMCQSATGPLYKVAKTVEGWFRPYKTELAFAKAQCKTVMGAYRVKLDADARAARELAASAAETGDADALVESLEIAIAAEQKPAGRASCGFKWIVKKIAIDMLPGYAEKEHGDEASASIWIPNRAHLDRYAAQYSGDETPTPIPGVVFEKVAKIGARK